MQPPGKAHVAIYGNTRILRSWCSECEGYALVLRGRLACCGELPFEAQGYKVFVPPRRRQPPPYRQQQILDEQEHRCLYCENLFGTVVMRGGREIVLRVSWDHFAPFSVFGDNRDGNFVAACQVCNTIKRAHIFQTVEEAKIHVRRRWGKAGISVLDLRDDV